MPYAKTGRLRALGVTSARRLPVISDVPTIAESGFKDYDLDIWYGLVAPARTPKQALSQLAEWSLAAITAPEMKPKLALQGLYPVGTCGGPFAAHLRKQFDDYARVIAQANIKAE